jgi:uncharacterized protein involved in oxidation of intracellular sulfur
MEFLIILDPGPAPAERVENALQLALTMTRRDDVTVRLFLMGDAVAAAKAEQGTLDGGGNPARTLRSLVMSGAELAVCDASLAARGLANDELIVGAVASPMSQLADWVLTADRVLTF